jgi:hypothetical protein
MPRALPRKRPRLSLVLLPVAFACLGVPPVTAQASCVPGDTTLCLQGGRFAVGIHWTDSQANAGLGHVVPYATDDSGVFWFFDSGDWEALVKVIDGCALNEHYWVFVAATTNVGYQVTVRDTLTASVRTYTNPQGRDSPAVTDTAAFSECSAAAHHGAALASEPPSQIRRGLERQESAGLDAESVPCVPGSTRGCLIDGRFSAEVAWTDGQEGAGQGQVVPFATDGSALFWFFSSTDWEIMVKVIDACNLNGRFWVFSAAVTDVQYTLTLTDTFTGAVRTYSQAAGAVSPATLDTGAFSGCADAGPPQVQLVAGSSITFTGSGQSAPARVQVVSANGAPIPNAAVTWTSSSPDLVTVHPDGPLSATITATGPGPGSSLITASYQGLVSSSADVLVVATDPTTLVVTSDMITQLTANSLTLVRNPSTERLKVGQVLVSGDDSGVLARVQAVALSSHQVDVQVTPVSLAAAYSSFVIDLSPQPLQLRATFRRGKALISLRSPSGKLLSARTLAGAQCSLTGGAQANVSLDAATVTLVQSLQPFVHAAGSSHSLQHFDFGLQGTASLIVDTGSLEFNSQIVGTVECILPLPAQGGQNLSIPLPVGPLWLDFAVMPSLGIDASATFQGPSLSIGGPVGQLQGSFAGGISYDRSAGWNLISSAEWSGGVTQSPPSFDQGSFEAMATPFARLTASVGVSLGNPLRPHLSIAIADLQFAQFEASGYGTFSLPAPLDPSDPAYSGPSWELGAGLTGSLMADLSSGALVAVLNALGITSKFAGPLDLFDVKYPLSQSPTLTIASQQSEVAPGNPVDIMTTSDQDVSGTIEIWSMPDGSSAFAEVAQDQFSAGSADTEWMPAATDAGTQTLRAFLQSDNISAFLPYPSTNTATVDVLGGPPIIDGISPDPVPALGGNQDIAILGDNFVQGATVTLTNATAGSGSYNVAADFLDSGTLSVNFAFGAANAVWSAQVINPDGSSSDSYYFVINVFCQGSGDSVLQMTSVPAQAVTVQTVNTVQVVDDPCGQGGFLNGTFTFYNQPEGDEMLASVPVACDGSWLTSGYTSDASVTVSCTQDFPPYPYGGSCVTYSVTTVSKEDGRWSVDTIDNAFPASGGGLLFTARLASTVDLNSGNYSLSYTGDGTLPFSYSIVNNDGQQQTCFGMYQQTIDDTLEAPTTLTVNRTCQRVASCQGINSTTAGGPTTAAGGPRPARPGSRRRGG